MTEVFIKAGTYILIICLAYFLKKIGFFKEGEHKTISKIVLNITLPAAILSSFNQVEQLSGQLFFILFVGFLGNVGLLAIAFLICRKKSKEDKIYWMCNSTGYNIGCFTLPYAQGFLGPIGVIVTCLFDAGNSIMCTGGTYAVASGVIENGQGEKINIKQTCKKLFCSVPFDCYLIAVIMKSFEVPFPAFVNQLSTTIGNANGFLSMMMIGMMLEIHTNKEYLKKVFSLLAVRYLFSAVMALVLYYSLPFAEDVRKTLAVISFAPLASLACVFTEKCNGDTELSSMTNSISVIISMIIMTVLILVI